MTTKKNEKVYSGQNIILKDGIEIAPGIFIYDDVIDNCKELIDFALLNSEKWTDSSVVDSALGSIVDKKIRDTKCLHIPSSYDNDIKWFEISQIVWLYANRYGIENEAPFSNMETMQLLHYSTEDGFYRPHVDSYPGSQRIFSALLYLNDVYEGGETYFDKFDVAISPKAGRLALFPANYVYRHEAKTPKSNDKFVIVTWFNPFL